MKTIQIKSIYGEVLFECEIENNAIKKTVEEAVRQGISLCDADLSDANLRGADLRRANLRGADFFEADLRSSDLRGANLCGASLIDADISRADLSEANISETNLYDANLSGAKNVPYIPMNCPSEGSFVGWKKINDKYLVKLQIPKDAKRSSATTMKCRCSKAKVLAITDLEGNNPINEVTNYAHFPLTYKVGKMVHPNGFNENRWNDCSNGIHFFINKQEAINY